MRSKLSVSYHADQRASSKTKLTASQDCILRLHILRCILQWIFSCIETLQSDQVREIKIKELTMKQDILILSSRKDHVEPAYTALVEHDIPTLIVTDGNSVLSALQSHIPAFLWLDMDMDTASPILAEIMDRLLYPPPYIILASSFSSSTDRADMLGQGADVCVELPVDLKEILALLNAVLRREERIRYVHTGNLLPCIEHKELFIDPLRRHVRMRGHAVYLTPKEFDLLYLLANSPGVAFSKEQLYSYVWKTTGNLGVSTVSDHISSLRQKLGLHPKNNEYIQTIFKVGYRFAEAI